MPGGVAENEEVSLLWDFLCAFVRGLRLINDKCVFDNLKCE